MRKYILLLVQTAIIIVFLNSCNEEPVPISVIEFKEVEMEVPESSGMLNSFHPFLIRGATGRTVSVPILLSKPLGESSKIKLKISGTAIRSSPSNLVGDYDIDLNQDVLIIEKGQVDANIELKVFEDFEFEYDQAIDAFFETVVVEFLEVIEGSVELGQKTLVTIKIKEDDAYVYLEWDNNNGDNNPYGDVDMDIIVWLDNSYLGSASHRDNYPEFINIPAGFPNGEYGLSYTYYSGSSDSLLVNVELFNAGGNIGGALTRNYSIVYTLDNLNMYDETTDNPEVHIAHTMSKLFYNYTNPTELQTPQNGSRMVNQKSKSKDRFKPSIHRINNINWADYVLSNYNLF